MNIDQYEISLLQNYLKSKNVFYRLNSNKYEYTCYYDGVPYIDLIVYFKEKSILITLVSDDIRITELILLPKIDLTNLFVQKLLNMLSNIEEEVKNMCDAKIAKANAFKNMTAKSITTLKGNIKS